MAKCPRCGTKLLHDVVRRGHKTKVFMNYRCPKCGKI